MSLTQPDRFFASLTSIDVERDLLGAGLDCALLDVDNTVRSRETGGVPRDVRKWMARARDAGISLCLLSNNWHSDVYAFAGELDLPIVAKACKPLPFGYAKAMRKVGGARECTVAIGDQLFTDVIGAHLAGIKAYLVLPLAEVDLKHTLLLRGLERGLLGSREPEPAFQGVRTGNLSLCSSEFPLRCSLRSCAPLLALECGPSGLFVVSEEFSEHKRQIPLLSDLSFRASEASREIFAPDRARYMNEGDV